MRSDSPVKDRCARAAAQLAAAWRDVEAARVAVGSGLAGDPGSAEQRLHHAAGCLRECEPLLRVCDRGERALLRETALRLAAELARLDGLLERAMSFWTGWAGRLGGLQAGYTAAGSPARPMNLPRVRVEA